VKPGNLLRNGMRPGFIDKLSERNSLLKGSNKFYHDTMKIKSRYCLLFFL
jgi:hypothetical protein